MPFEMFRLEADGQARPYRSVMRRSVVDRLLAVEESPVFAVDTNQLLVVGVSPGFPDASIAGQPFDQAWQRLGGIPPAESAPVPPPRTVARTHQEDLRLAGTAEAFGYLWMTLAAFVAVGTVLGALIAIGADDSDGWRATAVLLNGALGVAVLVSLGLILRVSAATLRRSLGR